MYGKGQDQNLRSRRFARRSRISSLRSRTSSRRSRRSSLRSRISSFLSVNKALDCACACWLLPANMDATRASIRVLFFMRCSCCAFVDATRQTRFNDSENKNAGVGATPAFSGCGCKGYLRMAGSSRLRLSISLRLAISQAVWNTRRARFCIRS